MTPSTFASDTTRWNAVQARDPAADGLFLYAVRTTKIYCRPVCKARLARRANVTFYAAAHEAERAGYRPCKRCKPNLSGQMPDEQAVRRIRTLIEQELPEAMLRQPTTHLQSLAKLAKQAGLSKWHFHRVFKEVAGMTPIEYLRQLAQVPKQDEAFVVSQPEDAILTDGELNFEDFLINMDTDIYQDLGLFLDT